MGIVTQTHLDATLDIKIPKKLITHTLALSSKADTAYVDSRLDEVRTSKADKRHVDSKLDEICESISRNVDPARVHELVAQPLDDMSRKLDAVETRVFRLIEVFVDGVPQPASTLSRRGVASRSRQVFDTATTDALLAVIRDEPTQFFEGHTSTTEPWVTGALLAHIRGEPIIAQ